MVHREDQITLQLPLEPQVKQIIKKLFQRVINSEEDPNHYLLQPTPESNVYKLALIKEHLLCLKKEKAEREVAKEKLVTAISVLKQDAVSINSTEMRRESELMPGTKRCGGRPPRPETGAYKSHNARLP
jgi:hypothetical protein